MRIGIGLPAAVPGTPATELLEWAGATERAGFQSLAVLDRLVYDNLDPLVALAAAAARTDRVEPAGFKRAATHGQGWVAPFFGHELLVDGMASIRQAWADAGRAGRPRVVAPRYLCLGPGANRPSFRSRM